MSGVVCAEEAVLRVCDAGGATLLRRVQIVTNGAMVQWCNGVKTVCVGVGSLEQW